MHGVHALHLVHACTFLPEGADVHTLLLEDLHNHPSWIHHEKAAARGIISKRERYGHAVPAQFSALPSAGAEDADPVVLSAQDVDLVMDDGNRNGVAVLGRKWNGR